MGFMAGPTSQLVVFTNTQNWQYWHYRSDTVNSKSFISRDLLQIKWNYELTMFESHILSMKWWENISQKL